jgi:hypothetical protein
LTPATSAPDARRERVRIDPFPPAHRRAAVEVRGSHHASSHEQRAQGRIEREPELARVLDRDHGEAIGRGEQPLPHPDHLEIPLANPQAGPDMEGAAHRQLRPDHDAPVVGQRQRAALRDRKGRIVPVRGGNGQVHSQDELLVQGEELRGGRVQRKHDLRLNGRHTGHGPESLDGLTAQETARRASRPGPDPGARHRDLPQDEAVAAVDEPADPARERAERHQPGHPDGDAGDRETVAAGEETPAARSPGSAHRREPQWPGGRAECPGDALRGPPPGEVTMLRLPPRRGHSARRWPG